MSGLPFALSHGRHCKLPRLHKSTPTRHFGKDFDTATLHSYKHNFWFKTSLFTSGVSSLQASQNPLPTHSCASMVFSLPKSGTILRTTIFWALANTQFAQINDVLNFHTSTVCILLFKCHRFNVELSTVFLAEKTSHNTPCSKINYIFENYFGLLNVFRQLQRKTTPKSRPVFWKFVEFFAVFAKLSALCGWFLLEIFYFCRFL